MKTDVAWLASSLAQMPLEKARNLNEFPSGMHCLISHQEKWGDFHAIGVGGERSQEKDEEEEEEGEGQMTGQEKKEREKSVVYPPWSCCPLSKHVFNTEPHLFLLMSKDAIFSVGRRNKILLAS